MGKLNTARRDRLVAFVNRKRWWHVPPRDACAYQKRGKFLASSYREAEFWGRPLNDAQRVAIIRPIIGDESAIEHFLFGERVSHADMGMDQRWRLDAKMKRVALARGYDSILLMSPQGFHRFRLTGIAPQSMELNILRPTPTRTVPK